MNANSIISGSNMVTQITVALARLLAGQRHRNDCGRDHFSGRSGSSGPELC